MQLSLAGNKLRQRRLAVVLRVVLQLLTLKPAVLCFRGVMQRHILITMMMTAATALLTALEGSVPVARNADIGATIAAAMSIATADVIVAIVVTIMTAVVLLQVLAVGLPEGALHSRFQPWTAQTCLRCRV